VVVIPPDERDPELKRALRTDPEDQTAILTWLVQGCLEWQRRGLDVPARVRDYTAEYRQENDPLDEWLADDCQLAAAHWTPAKELRDAYEHWSQQNGTKPIDAGRRWGDALKAHGCASTRSGGKRGWTGIELRVTGDR
jgi:putative DNA primase/helicase